MPELTAADALHYAAELQRTLQHDTPAMLGDFCRLRPEAGEELREALDLLMPFVTMLARAVERMHAADCAAAGGERWRVH